jgi:hypothetical protein
MVCACSIDKTKPTERPFVNVGTGYDSRWWVHNVCGKPDEAWLRSLGDDLLNFFQGGALDQRAYATSTLLDHQELMEGYRWTPEVLTSQNTGATARVWKHESVLDGQVAADAAQDQSDLVSTQQEERPMATLADRRKKLKISREVLAQEAGLTHSKVWRIEQEDGRTKPEEIKIVSDALDRLESKRGAATQPELEPAPQ